MVDYLSEIPLPGRASAEQSAALGPAAAHRCPAIAPSTFVAGQENRLVAETFIRLLASASTRVARDPRRHRVPTLLALFGPSGTGKTHLARGLTQYWQLHRGAGTALYLTSSDLRREHTAAIANDSIVDFRHRLRGMQLLAIDDLHLLPRDDSLAQELRYTLDACEENGATIVVTSRRSVSTLSNIPPDLGSRLTSGLVLQLASPAMSARLRIINQVAAGLGRPLSEKVARRLAATVPGTAVELFGALFELNAKLQAGTDSDSACADQLLAARAAQHPTLRRIIREVAMFHRLAQSEIRSSSRKRSAVAARGMVAYLARELASASYEEIGRALGGRDHTTIMHSYRKTDSARRHDPEIREALAELRRTLATQ